MDTRVIAAGCVFCAIIGALVAGCVQDLRFTAKIKGIESTHADDRAQWEADRRVISDKAQTDTAAALNRMKTAQDALAALDALKSKELADAQAENNRLRDDVAAGNRRVRILAASLATTQLAASVNAAGGDSGTSGLGDATQVELTAAAGRTVYDIRAGIISDQAKLDYLQSYVRDVVRQCKRE